MGVKVNTADLAKLQQLLREMGGHYTATLQNVSASAREKLTKLAMSGRPLTTASPAMRNAIERYVGAEMARAKDFTRGLFVRTAEAALLGVFRLRLENEGNDLAWRKSPAGYRASKARRGLDTRTGVATGALLREIKGARVELVKR